jgi:hypothetical protein
MIHEVVVRNRLEHLRRRQRDEALQAQQQLLADVKPGTRTSLEHDDTIKEKTPEIAYLECMSPRLTAITKLSHEDMELEFLSVDIDQQNLVSVGVDTNQSLTSLSEYAKKKGH